MNTQNEWCRDVADVPKLSGPIMPIKAAVIVPDWNRLARAYSDAGWRWCREIGEPVPEKESFEEWKHSGWPPNAERIEREVQLAIDRLDWENGDKCQYCQFGGIVIFRSLSGKPGMLIEWVLAEHWIRGKADANLQPATCNVQLPPVHPS